jgi:predicted membrane protein
LTIHPLPYSFEQNLNTMSDFQTRMEERRKRMEERWGKSYYAKGSIWTGVFIILVGIAALIKASVPDLPEWLFGWQTFLIALGVFIGVRHGFKGASWLILMLIGGAFLIRDINPDLMLRRYTWPFIMILVGIFLIFRPRRHWQWGHDEKKNEDQQKSAPLNEEKESYSKDDFVDATSIFGGCKKNILSKNFKGGDLVNIFGGTELNLTQADFTDTAVIELTTIFGGTKLIVPSNWAIKSEAVTIFGGMEDKRSVQSLAGTVEKTLILRGTIIFGGIEIKSY